MRTSGPASNGKQLATANNLFHDKTLANHLLAQEGWRQYNIAECCMITYILCNWYYAPFTIAHLSITLMPHKK